MAHSVYRTSVSATIVVNNTMNMGDVNVNYFLLNVLNTNVSVLKPKITNYYDTNIAGIIIYFLNVITCY